MDNHTALSFQLCVLWLDAPDTINLGLTCKRLWDFITSENTLVVQYWEYLFVKRHGIWFRRNLDIKSLTYNHFKRFETSITNFKDGVYKSSFYRIISNEWTRSARNNHLIILSNKICYVYNLASGQKSIWKGGPDKKLAIHHQYLLIEGNTNWKLFDVIEQKVLHQGNSFNSEYVILKDQSMVFPCHRKIFTVSYQTGQLLRTLAFPNDNYQLSRDFVIDTSNPLKVIHLTNSKYDQEIQKEGNSDVWVKSLDHNACVSYSSGSSPSTVIDLNRGKSVDIIGAEFQEPCVISVLPPSEWAFQDFDSNLALCSFYDHIAVTVAGTEPKKARYTKVQGRPSVLFKMAIVASRHRLTVLNPFTDEEYNLELPEKDFHIGKFFVVVENLDLKIVAVSDDLYAVIGVWDFSQKATANMPQGKKRKKNEITVIDFTSSVTQHETE